MQYQERKFFVEERAQLEYYFTTRKLGQGCLSPGAYFFAEYFLTAIASEFGHFSGGEENLMGVKVLFKINCKLDNALF